MNFMERLEKENADYCYDIDVSNIKVINSYSDQSESGSESGVSEVKQEKGVVNARQGTANASLHKPHSVIEPLWKICSKNIAAFVAIRLSTKNVQRLKNHPEDALFYENILSSLSYLPPHCAVIVLYLLAKAGYLDHDKNNDIFKSLLSEEVVAVDLSDCSYSGDAISFKLASACPYLHTLNLGSSKIQYRNVYLSLLKDHQHLVELNLAECSLITDEILIEALVYCKSLTNLNLSSCDITNDSILALSEHSTSLQVLNLANVRIDNESVAYLKKMQNLHTLIIKRTNITSLLLEDEEVWWSKLKYLDIRSLYLVDSEDWLKVLSHIDNKAAITTFRAGECMMNREILSTILPQCSGMEYLDLSWMQFEELDSKLLSASLEKVTEVKTLKLRSISVLDDLCFKSIAMNCRKLTHLNVCRSYLLTDKHIDLLATNCGLVKDLNLAWSRVSFDGVVLILRKMKQLECLTVQGIDLIGSDLLLVIASNTGLQFIDLSWCNGVDTCVAEELIVRRPDMYVIDYYGESYRGCRFKGVI